MDIRGRKVLILGDSLSAASTAPGGRLAKALRADGATVTVNAVVGRSSSSLFREQPAVLPPLIAGKPDLVIVFLGTNDLPSFSAARSATAFGRIAAAFPGAAFTAIGPPAFPRRSALDANVEGVYQILRNTFGAANVVDARPASVGATRTSDGVHFTSAGAATFAERLYAILMPPPADEETANTPGASTFSAGWRWAIGALGLAAVGVAWAIHRRRRVGGAGVGRRPLSGPHADALPDEEREKVDSRVREEVDQAVERAVAAGAQVPLSYMGAGMEGIVFCDPSGAAFKVGRGGPRTLAKEAAFFRKANQIPAIAANVAKFYRYSADQDVLVRECIREERPKKGSRRYLPNRETKAWETAARIDAAMVPYGFTGPERKSDSFVYARGRGMVLVDGGFAIKVGRELVKETLDKIHGRVPRGAFDDNESLAFDIRQERGRTIPKPIADRVRATLGDNEPLAGVRVHRRIPAVEVTATVEAIRAGDARSKRKGVKYGQEPPTARGDFVEIDLPLTELLPHQIEYLRESTDAQRVARYVVDRPDTPIVIFRGRSGRRSSPWVISDGGHRIVAAVDRGDATVRAIVPDAAARERGLLGAPSAPKVEQIDTIARDARRATRGRVQRRRERIPGGTASGGRCPADTNPRELRQGVAVEREHTRDPRVAREIACDHLTEDPRYYTKLAKLGL